MFYELPSIYKQSVGQRECAKQDYCKVEIEIEREYQLGDLRLSLHTQFATGPRGAIRLYSRPFQTLECLMRRPGTPVNQEGLLLIFYPDGAPATAVQVLRNIISNIRTCCRAVGAFGVSIDPVPGIGYRIVKIER